MGRATQFNTIGRPDLSTYSTPTRLPPANHGFNISEISASSKIWRNSRKTCKTPESKDCPTTPVKKSARGPNPIGKDCREFRSGWLRLHGGKAQYDQLTTSLASANPGDPRRLATCPGRPKDMNRRASASRYSALLSFGPFRPRLRIAMIVSARRPCRSPIRQRVSKLLLKTMAWSQRCSRLFCLHIDFQNMGSSVQALRARYSVVFSLAISWYTTAGTSSQASRH